MTQAIAQLRENLIREYFAGCNEADVDKMRSCFIAEAVHYFPPGLPDIPWRGARAIAEKWKWCVETLGSRWTIDNVIVGATGDQAVIEWTHWKTAIGEVLRGDEWYVFDGKTGLIREIRAYYASPVDKSAAVNALVDFDYQGRGYTTRPPP